MRSFIESELQHVGFDSGSLRTYSMFFGHLEECLQLNWSGHKLMVGYILAGTTVPTDKLTMLQRCSSCNDGSISELAQQQVLDRLPQLDEQGNRRWVKDEEMTFVFGDIVAINIEDLKSETSHTSHKRAICIYRKLEVGKND